MHFSIPDTQEICNDGLNYIGYNLHVNGVFHSTIRYRQFYNLFEDIKKEYCNISNHLPKFPPKKLLPLSGIQLEERRAQLEKYIQAGNIDGKLQKINNERNLVGQDPILAGSGLFSNFLLNAQQATSGVAVTSASVDVFLMNGFKICINVVTNERTDSVLCKVCDDLDLPKDLSKYFALFLARIEQDESEAIQRRLQDFESPYISLNMEKDKHKIVLRKNYWDSNIDLFLMSNKVALNLLYVQTVSDVEKGWILASNETLRKLARFQSQGAKREYMELARTLKFYGYLIFKPCTCDYPYEGSKVIVSAGNKELNLRIRLSNEDDVRQGSFKITRMRCWRITTLHPDDLDPSKTSLELSFEYLMARNKLQWITIVSDQAVLMSMCLQSMVAELLLNSRHENAVDVATPSSSSSSSSTSESADLIPPSRLLENLSNKSRIKVLDKYTASFSNKGLLNHFEDSIGDDDL